MIKLASFDNCTGCGACSFVCSRSAIILKPNNVGVVLPEIDHSKCVQCGQCQRVCPSLNPPELFKPLKAYAGWNNKTNERVTSASGAIASAAYKIAIEKGWNIAGAIQKKDFSVDVVVSDKAEDIALFKNSKYVFSSISLLLPRIKQNIEDRKKTLVIALPCQIAAIRKCFPGNTNLLILADLVCHGCTPHSYLSQHIKNIEDQKGKKAESMSFRDPRFNTYTYTFTLYEDNGEIIYAKRTKDGDVYQVAYHRMISYRENCFNCHYARPERVGDFTLADYSSLGQKSKFEYNKINCSCILVNTKNGQDFLYSLIENEMITAVERPIEEPTEGNSQLQRHCKKSKARRYFEKQIEENNGDFVKTMDMVFPFYLKEQRRDLILSFPRRSFSLLKEILIKIKRKIS